MAFTALDILKYHAATGKSSIEWAIDSISGNVYHGLPDEDAGRIENALETPIDVIDDYAKSILASVREVEPEFDLSTGLYSDGRQVTGSLTIEDGTIFSHTWHYDLRQEIKGGETYTTEPSNLSADPGQYRGTYTVEINPKAQKLTLHVMLASFSYYSEPDPAVENWVANVGVGSFTAHRAEEKVALDIGDSINRQFVYLDPDEADALAASLTGAAEVLRESADDVH